MTGCSADGCNEVAKHEIQLRGSSPFTNKKYLMWVYVCTNHYQLERREGLVFAEKKVVTFGVDDQ